MENHYDILLKIIKEVRAKGLGIYQYLSSINQKLTLGYLKQF
jgi:hypothetical protein